MTDERSILAEMKKAVEDGDEEVAASAAQEAVEAGIDPQRAILEGLVPGMTELGRQYEVGECYVPELIVAAEALYAGLGVLQPLIAASAEGARGKGVVVIGAVQGDVHDIGKNLVKLMLEVDGFDIHDLGRDVPMEQFLEECQRLDADLLCMSSLMTTTMAAIKDYMPEFKAKLPRTKVLIGGAPISQRLADEWGADGYAENAVEAARVASKLVEVTGPVAM
jgi:corrinoid protein of di/trimethylamine methyltransferase